MLLRSPEAAVRAGGEAMDLSQISRLGVALAALGCATALPAQAFDCALCQKIERLQNQLIHLPPQASTPSQVSRLVLQLSRLRPQYANVYFRWGISKLPYEGYDHAQTRLAAKVTQIVEISGLPTRTVTKLSLQIEQAVQQSAVTPTPSPYQARMRPLPLFQNKALVEQG